MRARLQCLNSFEVAVVQMLLLQKESFFFFCFFLYAQPVYYGRAFALPTLESGSMDEMDGGVGLGGEDETDGMMTARL